MIPPNSFFKSPKVMDYSVCLTVKSACSKVVQWRHNDAKTQCFFMNHWVILIHTFLTLRWSVVLRLECVCSLGSQFRRGAGVLDMVFETPSQLLTCGYDTFVRMWDLRLNPRYVTISFFSGWASIFTPVFLWFYFHLTPKRYRLAMGTHSMCVTCCPGHFHHVTLQLIHFNNESQLRVNENSSLGWSCHISIAAQTGKCRMLQFRGAPRPSQR